MRIHLLGAYTVETLSVMAPYALWLAVNFQHAHCNPVCQTWVTSFVCRVGVFAGKVSFANPSQGRIPPLPPPLSPSHPLTCAQTYVCLSQSWCGHGGLHISGCFTDKSFGPSPCGSSGSDFIKLTEWISCQCGWEMKKKNRIVSIWLHATIHYLMLSICSAQRSAVHHRAHTDTHTPSTLPLRPWGNLEFAICLDIYVLACGRKLGENPCTYRQNMQTSHIMTSKILTFFAWGNSSNTLVTFPLPK